MIIGVDLDDVLSETGDALLAFFNQRHGANLSVTQLVPYGSYEAAFESLLSITRQEVFDGYAAFNLLNSTLLPRPNAQFMIARLAQQHTLHIITNRPMENANQTILWLDQHFPKQFADIHFCTMKNGGKTIRTKSSVCKHLRAPLLLEDHPENALICARDGIHIYLFDQPWNRRSLPWPLKGIVTRVSCWHDQILETLVR